MSPYTRIAKEWLIINDSIAISLYFHHQIRVYSNNTILLNGLTAPTTIRTDVGLWDFSDNDVVHQALRADVEWFVAHWTDGLSTEIADTSDSSAWGALDCVLLAKFISALITSKLANIFAHWTSSCQMLTPHCVRIMMQELDKSNHSREWNLIINWCKNQAIM